MARTYYKYAEREAESRINWAEVGKTMSDTIGEELKIREEKKKRIDDASREFGQILENAPLGEMRGFNDWTLDFAENAQKALLMQDTLLKSGQLSLKDYTLQRQNLLDGTSNSFKVIKTWNDDFSEAKKKLEAGELDAQSQYELMQMERLGNFNSHSLFINPTTFKVSLGERELQDPSKPYDPEDNPYTGFLKDDPNTFQSVQQLSNRFQQLQAPYDPETALKTSANNLAKTYKILQGKYTTLDDVREHPDWQQAKHQMVVANLGSSKDRTASSILTDFLQFTPSTYTKLQDPSKPFDAETNPLIEYEVVGAGEEFDFTNDPDDPRLYNADGERNQNMILLIPNPDQPNSGAAVGDLTEEQMGIAYDALAAQLDVMVDREAEAEQKRTSPRTRKTDTQRREEDTDKAMAALINDIITKDEYEGSAQELASKYNLDKLWQNQDDILLKSIIRQDTDNDGVVDNFLIITDNIVQGQKPKDINVFKENGERKTNYEIAQELYSHLGEGSPSFKRDFSTIAENWGKDFGDVNDKNYTFERDVKKIDTTKTPSLKNKVDGEKITTVFSKLPSTHSAAYKEAPPVILNWLTGFFNPDNVSVVGKKEGSFDKYNSITITINGVEKKFDYKKNGLQFLQEIMPWVQEQYKKKTGGGDEGDETGERNQDETPSEGQASGGVDDILGLLS